MEDLVSKVDVEESELPIIKTLGVRWDAKEDSFGFQLNVPRDVCYTKRGIL